MTQEEVVALMAASDKDNWLKDVQKVREAHGGKLPDYWYTSILNSGLCAAKMGQEYAQKFIQKTHKDMRVQHLSDDPMGTGIH